MATVTHMNVDYSCATAIRGDDYVHLLNEDGEMTVAFDGISDFKDFSIADGDWTSPTADHNCYVAVVKDDGTMGKGGHKCSDILPTTGGTITGSIASNTSAKGFNCTVGSYDVRLMANSNGNRGLYDNNTGSWLVCKDSSNKVTLNGFATNVASGEISVKHCGSWSGEIEANGYTSTLSLTPTTISGYTFLYPLSFGSNSSYFCCYGLLYVGGKIQLYGRNINSKSITPTIDLYGLYIKN